MLSPTHIRWALILSALVLAGLTGCRGSEFRETPIHPNPNMDNQDRYKSYGASSFFSDGRAMRTPPEGTVARGKLRQDDALWRGKNAQGEFVTQVPFTLTLKDLNRGRTRYNIYCAPCHDKAGYGKGKVALRSKGMLNPPTFHQPRLGVMALGQLFDVISNGTASKLMPSYRHQMPDPKDRWAVVAYIRALQRSQNADLGHVRRYAPDELKAMNKKNSKQ